MRRILFFTVIFLSILSTELSAQKEYLGYSSAVLEAMAREGDDIEKAKIERFQAYLKRLDELKTAFYNIYDDPGTDAELRNRVEERLEALAALKLNANEYRILTEQGEYGNAAVSYALYEQALDILKLKEYFEGLFLDLESAKTVDSTDDRQVLNSSPINNLGPSQADNYNLWLSLAPMYNWFHYNVNQADNSPAPISEFDPSGGIGFSGQLGFAYKILGPISIYTELGLASQNVSSTYSEFSDPFQWTYQEDFTLSSLTLSLGFNYLYEDWNFKFGYHYMSHFSANLDWNYIYENFNAAESVDLMALEDFRNSQHLLAFELAYEILEFEAADTFLDLHAFFRPVISLSNNAVIGPDGSGPLGLDTQNFGISQFNLGIRLQY